jgi:hypothetical protein
MPLSLILDIVLAVLLIVTIGYAVALNRRLGALRQNKDELERLARGFVETTSRAENGIGELKSMTEILQERIERAESLRDDLVFLTDRGNATADRLEGVVREARDNDRGAQPAATKPAQPAVERTATVKPQAPPAQKPREPLSAGPGDRINADGVSDAERELLKALRSAG